MCGIVGKVSSSAAVDRALLETMCQLVEHRGPDSRGTFLDDGVGLGIQRLAVIDLESGDQPVYNEDRSVVVVLNGEIYNYVELREDLRRRGHRLATSGDTEVIAHLYEEHGADCVSYLRGMFAFAIWDRARRTLLLARDRIGKKPLFYCERGGTLWFASEPRAILADPLVPRDPDVGAIDCFLQMGYVPHPFSAFAALRKLPPAHLLTWSDGQLRTRRYWKLSYAPGRAAGSAPERQEQIREALLEATRLRLRSDVPLGAFLSGGVDSSAVVAAMARTASGRVRTFSIGFDVEEFDETAYAREIAELFGTEHHELRVEPHALEILPKLVWHYGEPFADSSAIPSMYLAELTRRHVTVALNGDGGDESFAGYRRYVAYRLMSRLDRLPRAMWGIAAGLSDAAGPGARVDGPRARASRLTHAMLAPPLERHRLWMNFVSRAELASLYTPDFAAGAGSDLAARALEDAYSQSDAGNDLDRLLDTDVNTYLPGQLLTKVDIATMAYSLEVRSPLLDHRLMELAAALEPDDKVHRLTTKRIFKDALRAWLPDHILERRKTGFGVPLAKWFAGELRALPGEVLLDDRSTARGIFRREAVAALIDDHVAGRRDNSNRLWALIQLELWLRTYIDRTDIAAPLSLPVAVAG
jgi:asparagine synthase (glutamine-hydrolysing)